MTPEESQALAHGTAAALATAKGYADIILKPPLEQVGGILSDTIGLWRLKNQVNVMLKAKKFLEDKGVKKPTKLQPDIFVPLLEQASYTEDETLSDMFARLLAANADAERSNEVHPSFAKVLGQMSAFDAKVLLRMDEIDERFRADAEMKRQLEHSPKTILEVVVRMTQARKEDWDQWLRLVNLAIANIDRLGLSAKDGKEYYKVGERGGQLIGDRWTITHYGSLFLIACHDADYWRRDKATATDA